MDSVEAVACDMNSDFQEAFEERCPHIQPVFDYFHIVKNFNDKVVNEVRRAEQRRLLEEGDIEAAKSLKRTRYILTSSRSTLQRKDAERLLTNHFEGVIAHATYPISSGKVEGINQRIKTLRRQGYGYPDDEYFFLKLFDMSRTGYTRNAKSHGFRD